MLEKSGSERKQTGSEREARGHAAGTGATALTNMIANMGPNMGANSARQHACGTGRNGKEREANGKGANMCQLLSLDPCSGFFPRKPLRGLSGTT